MPATLSAANQKQKNKLTKCFCGACELTHYGSKEILPDFRQCEVTLTADIEFSAPYSKLFATNTVKKEISSNCGLFEILLVNLSKSRIFQAKIFTWFSTLCNRLENVRRTSSFGIKKKKFCKSTMPNTKFAKRTCGRRLINLPCLAFPAAACTPVSRYS